MITKNYISMCEQAEEIQKEWKPKLLDKVITKKTLTNNNYSQHAVSYIEDFEHPYDEYYYKNYGFIYLPNLEQLFEMYKPKWDNGSTYLDRFYWWGKKQQYNPSFNGVETTWQELVLAFIMKEKWNKIWTGEDWVKNDKS